MAHTLAIPERSLRNVIWLPSELDGAPVVKVHDRGPATREPSTPRTTPPMVTVKVVLAGSEPDGVKRTIRRTSSSSPAAPSGAESPTLSEMGGVIDTRLSLTVPGWIARSKTTAMEVVVAIPRVPSAGTAVRAVRPAETVVNARRNGPARAVPA